MTRRRRALLAMYGTAAALLAIPWGIDAVRALSGRAWRSPAVPVIRFGRLDTSPRPTRRTP